MAQVSAILKGLRGHKNTSDSCGASRSPNPARIYPHADSEPAIQIGFTDQKVTGHAGLVPFCGFLHWQRFHALLAGVLPYVRTSPKAIPPADLALGFIVGLLAAQLVRIEGHVWKGAATESTIETVFGLTSRAAASPAALLAAQREHWGAIENGQHHRRDRTYREDDSPVRDPNATPCYAALRALAIPPPAILTAIIDCGSKLTELCKFCIRFRPARKLLFDRFRDQGQSWEVGVVETVSPCSFPDALNRV